MNKNIYTIKKIKKDLKDKYKIFINNYNNIISVYNKDTKLLDKINEKNMYITDIYNYEIKKINIDIEKNNDEYDLNSYKKIFFLIQEIDKICNINKNILNEQKYIKINEYTEKLNHNINKKKEIEIIKKIYNILIYGNIENDINEYNINKSNFINDNYEDNDIIKKDDIKKEDNINENINENDTYDTSKNDDIKKEYNINKTINENDNYEDNDIIKNDDIKKEDNVNKNINYKNIINNEIQKIIIIKGIHNLGNTCFFNSSIQCLINIQPLTYYILKKLYKTKNGNNIIDEYRKMLEQKNPVFDPTNLFNVIITKNNIYINYDQQDSREFMNFFIEEIIKETSNEMKNTLKIGYINEKKISKVIKFYKEKNKNIFHYLLQNILRTTYECNGCGDINHRDEISLFIEIGVLSGQNIYECIENNLKEEIINDDWYCEKCRKYNKLKKNYIYIKFPPYILFHIKKNISNINFGIINYKIDKDINYYNEIDLNKYILDEKKEFKYNLIGIIKHMGSADAGHYVFYGKKKINGIILVIRVIVKQQV